jgi:hypothetical protein
MALARRRAKNACCILCRHLLIFSAALLSASCLATTPALAEGAASTRAARFEATRAIPWRQLAARDRQIAQAVVKNASIYRRLPTRIIDCDPEMFNFLLQHPEVVIDVWRVMGISQVSLQKLSDGSYRGMDGAGTVGNVRFLHADWGAGAKNTALVFADGAYEGKPFVTPLKMKSVVLLRSGSVQETNGRHYVTVRIDSFMKIEQMGVELVVKTVQPWISQTADRNYIETLTFVSNFSRTAEKNPHGIERLAARLSRVDDPTRSELVAVSFRTAERYASLPSSTSEQAALLAHRPVAPNESSR